jgi:hypothetical protein
MEVAATAHNSSTTPWMSRHLVVEEEEEQMREREWCTHLGEKAAVAAMEATRHTPGERRRQAKPSQATTEPQHQHTKAGLTAAP